METTPTRQQVGDDLLTADQIQSAVEEILTTTPFIDIHTHLFAPAFGSLGLWGIDELLTYHYLEAELFPSSSISPEHYWELPKRKQADEIWRTCSSKTVRSRKPLGVSSLFWTRLTCRPMARISKKPDRSSVPNGSNRTS